MEQLDIDLPCEGYQGGDLANVLLDGVGLLSMVELVPGALRHPGHLLARHLLDPHLGAYAGEGHLEGRHLFDGHLQPQRHVRVQTAPLYHGPHAVTVATRDACGNESSPVEIETFINTGPRPPSRLRFGSQVGSGPIAFTFKQSPELANA